MSGREKEARNQAIFREVNERIEQLAEGFDADGLLGFICECGNSECTQQIEMTRAEYEHVRADVGRFAVAIGHENAKSGTVVDRTERFAVVKTQPQASAAMAPRGNPDPRIPQARQRTADGAEAS